MVVVDLDGMHVLGRLNGIEGSPTYAQAIIAADEVRVLVTFHEDVQVTKLEATE